MKQARVIEAREWFHTMTGERIFKGISTRTLPTGYDPKRHDTRGAGYFIYEDIRTGCTYSVNPPGYYTADEVAEYLKAHGYEVVD